MQEYSQLHSLPSPRLLITIPSHFLNFPPKTFTCKSILNFTVSPLQDFLSRFQVIFKTSPPKPLHARVFSTSQSPLSKTSCHDSKSFFKLSPLNLYMQEYSQLHSLPSPRLLITIPSHFLNFPPQKCHDSKTSYHDSKLLIDSFQITCLSFQIIVSKSAVPSFQIIPHSFQIIVSKSAVIVSKSHALVSKS